MSFLLYNLQVSNIKTKNWRTKIKMKDRKQKTKRLPENYIVERKTMADREKKWGTNNKVVV